MLGGFLLYIKYMGMTVGAVQPLHMCLMRKDSRRDAGHLCFQRKGLVQAYGLRTQDFLDCSYGFRPNRSALEVLWRQCMNLGIRWILDVDIQKFFDTLDLRICGSFSGEG